MAPTKVGSKSTGLFKELIIGHESCLGNRGSTSLGRNGSFAAWTLGSERRKSERKKMLSRDTRDRDMAEQSTDYKVTHREREAGKTWLMDPWLLRGVIISLLLLS